MRNHKDASVFEFFKSRSIEITLIRGQPKHVRSKCVRVLLTASVTCFLLFFTVFVLTFQLKPQVRF